MTFTSSLIEFHLNLINFNSILKNYFFIIMTDDMKLMPDYIKFMSANDRDLNGCEFPCPTGREIDQTQ